MNTRNWRTGFTLIEILVVLAIIGILSAVLYANFGEARDVAKNKAFMSEMKELQLGLELYKAQNGQYPQAQDISSTNCLSNSFGVSTAKSSACGSNPVIVGLAPEFVPALPSSAKSANPNCDIEYVVDDDGTWDGNDGSWYKVTAINCLVGGLVSVDDELARCPNVVTCNGFAHCSSGHIDFGDTVAVYSSGGECK